MTPLPPRRAHLVAAQVEFEEGRRGHGCGEALADEPHAVGAERPVPEEERREPGEAAAHLQESEAHERGR